MINISGAPPGSFISPPPDYYDHYSGPANPACFLLLNSSQDWGGQSFTPTKSYYAKRIELWIKKGPGSDIGNIDVELWCTGVEGHPAPPMLSSGIIANADVSENYAWVLCNFEVFDFIDEDTKYCIVVHGDSLDVDNTLIWACGGDGSGLPNGDQEWSINGGSTWSTDTTRDQLFRVYPLFLQEHYNVGGTQGAGSTTNPENAQTFTTQKAYELKSVRLLTKRLGTIVADCVVEIFATDVNGHITGGALVSVALDGSGWHDVDYKWREWEFSTPLALASGVKYAIWLLGTGHDNTNCPVWFYDVTGEYPRGNYEYKYLVGEWTEYVGKDFMFETWSLNE